MKNFNELENFIKRNPDWLDKLKPWLKSAAEVEYNPDWLVLMYNLFDIPEDPELYKIICQCRGTVVNKRTGEIICAPFVKFWNFGEPHADKNIVWNKTIFTSKIDGWIVKLAKYNDKVFVFTNGRALSEKEPGAPVDLTVHPEYKFKTISDIYLYLLGASSFNKDGSVHWEERPSWVSSIAEGDTVMFELETPWNVVVTHLTDEPKLWLIGYRKSDGQEINVFKQKTKLPFETPKVYDFSSVEEAFKEMEFWSCNKEGEGVVALYVDEGNGFHRVKIKCKDYLNAKYLNDARDLSDNRLLKIILNEADDDLAAAVPELRERISLIKDKIADFKNLCYSIEKELIQVYPKVGATVVGLVDYIKQNHSKHFGLYMSCFKSPEKTFQKYINTWKVKTNGFVELCDLLL